MSHWRGRLAGLAPLELPTDRPRGVPPAPADRLHPGGVVPMTVPAPVAAELRELGRRRGATLFTVVLAAWQALLARLAGTDDLAVGVPHARRDRSEVEGLVGLFVDTLVIRAQSIGGAGGEPFSEHLDRVRRSAATAFAHADLPFEKVAEAATGGAGHDLVRAFFAYDATPAAGPALPGIEVERVDLHSGTAKFDLTLSLEEEDAGSLRGELEYDARLFDRETAVAWARELEALLARIAADPESVLEPGVPRERVLASPEEDDGEVTPLGADDPIAELAAEVWGEVLELGRPARAHERFFDLGGHSLLGARAVARIAAAAEVDLPVRVLFDHPRLDRFVAAVREARRGTSGAAVPPVHPVFQALTDARASEPFDAPATHAQIRLWFLDRLAPGSPVYSMPLAARLDGPVSAAALARAFRRLARRHAVLRTRLVEVPGQVEPLQRIEPVASVALVPCLADLSGLEPEMAIAESRRLARLEAHRPFELDRAPLARVVLVRRSAADHDLLVNLHHAIADGASLHILLDELAAGHGTDGAEGGRPSGSIQYADYAAWARARRESGAGGREVARDLSFWRRELDGMPPLDLLGGDPREEATPFAGGAIPLALPAPVGEAVRRAARELGATPFLIFLAVFQALLARVSGQRDFGVATPVANRRRPELEGLIGLFVDTLILRADLTPEGASDDDPGRDPGLETLVARARRRALDAFDHQELPFDTLVETLASGRRGPGRGASVARPPLAQVMLVVQDGRAPTPRLAGVTATPFDRESGTSKLDLTLSIRAGQEGGFVGYLEYAAARFDAGTAERLAAAFVHLLESALADPDRPFGELPLLPPGEEEPAIRREASAGPEPTSAAPAPFVDPRDPLEEAVASAWRELLGAERIGVHDDFFGAGGHSLLAARLASSLRERLGVDLPVASLFRSPTVAGQAAEIRVRLAGGEEGAVDAPEPLPAEERRRGVPLAPGQARLLFLHRLQDGPLYHLPLGLRIAGPLDPAALTDALADVVARHEAFRLRVIAQRDDPENGGELQAAAEPWRPALPVVDLSSLPEAAADRAAEQPPGPGPGSPSTSPPAACWRRCWSAGLVGSRTTTSWSSPSTTWSPTAGPRGCWCGTWCGPTTPASPARPRRPNRSSSRATWRPGRSGASWTATWRRRSRTGRSGWRTCVRWSCPPIAPTRRSAGTGAPRCPSGCRRRWRNACARWAGSGRRPPSWCSWPASRRSSAAGPAPTT